MADAAPEREDVATPPAVGSAEPARGPAQSSDLDSLLGEYEQGTAKADASAEPNQANTDADLDAALRDVDVLRDLDQTALSQANSRAQELEGQNTQLRDYIFREQEQTAFKSFTAELQSKLPENLPDDYAQTQLLAMAVGNPDLTAAWDLRNVDRAAVDTELSRVEHAHAHLQRNPAAADPQKFAALTQYGYRLGLALNSKAILQRATSEIKKRADQYKPIDPELTADVSLWRKQCVAQVLA
jgi:hypothetical protein